MKATEQYFPVVLFIMRFKMVLHFQSVSMKYHNVTRFEIETPSSTYFPVRFYSAFSRRRYLKRVSDLLLWHSLLAYLKCAKVSQRIPSKSLKYFYAPHPALYCCSCSVWAFRGVTFSGLEFIFKTKVSHIRQFNWYNQFVLIVKSYIKMLESFVIVLSKSNIFKELI